MAGSWYNAVDSNGYLRRKTATQYHDVIGFSLGKWLAAVAQFLTGLYILGVAIQQVVASASSQFTIDTKFNKRYVLLPRIQLQALSWPIRQCHSPAQGTYRYTN